MTSYRKSTVDPRFFSTINQGVHPIFDTERKTLHHHVPSAKKEQRWYAKGTSKNENKDQSKNLDTSKDSLIRYEDENTLVIIGQGGDDDININLKDTRGYVRQLRDNYATEYIHELEKKGKKSFEAVKNLVEALRETPAYEAIHDIIQDEFKCMEDSRYRLGTVGAYFCECGMSKDFPGNPNCSLGCLSGLNRNIGDKLCEYNCLAYIGDGTLSLLQSVEGCKEAYLFVDESLEFRGLRDVEIDQLRSMNITHVKIVFHSEGSSYQTITNFKEIHQLHIHRNTPNQGSKKKSGSSRDSPAIAGLLILILLIIILIALWFWYKNKGDGGNDNYYYHYPRF